MKTSAHGPMMTIGSFARASRLSVKALRLYERHRLLEPHATDPATGYRYYHPDQLARAGLIARLRSLSMPLAHVAAVLSAPDEADADRQLAFWWAEQEHNTAVRRALVRSLRLARAPADEDAEMPAGVLEAPSWEVVEREVPEWLLVTEQRNVAPHQLPTFIADAIGRLSQLSHRTPGTPQTPVLAIYHARVNEDGDGPVEVCIALDPADVSSVIDQGLPHGVSMRREAGHRELCVTLTKRQVVYPDILAAYELIETQARSDNRETIAPPREQYFADLHAARPDDEVCHVALPVE